MTHLRRAARVDGNQAEVIKALKACGVSVEIIGKPVDLLVCVRGRTELVEIKNPDGRDQLTKAQVEFIARWPGKIHVVNGPREAVQAVVGSETMADAFDDWRRAHP